MMCDRFKATVSDLPFSTSYSRCLECGQVSDSGEQGKMEKTGCKIISGAPTTLAVKGLMMMMK